MVNNSSGNNTSGNLFQTSLTTNGVVYAATGGVISSTAAGTAGQVLTSNGSGSAPTYQSIPDAACLFYAYANTNQTIAAAGATTIAFGTATINVGSAFASNTFTAPTTGIYFFNFQVLANATTVGDSIWFLYNGGSQAQSYNGTVVGTYEANCTIIMSMTANDTMGVQYQNNNGAVAATVFGVNATPLDTWFQGFRLT